MSLKLVLGSNVILIAGIFPRASSNGAHGSQSDDSTYLFLALFVSFLKGCRDLC